MHASTILLGFRADYFMSVSLPNFTIKIGIFVNLLNFTNKIFKS